MATNVTDIVASIYKDTLKKDLPDFHPGDTVKVHVKIVEGTKERIQVFEGVVLKRNKGNLPDASFTVRKVSYNVGVERTFPLHSPRIDKLEVISRAKVRRARLYYLQPLRGKAARMKTRFEGQPAVATGPAAAPAASTTGENGPNVT